MKRLLCVVLCALFLGGAQAQSIGALGIGWTNYVGEKDELSQISNSGFSISGLVPIRVQHIDMSAKLKLSVFSSTAESNSSRTTRLANVINEILVGKACNVDKYRFLSQIGFGICGESLYTDWDIGTFTLDSFLDFSMLISRKFDFADLGALINYETSLRTIDESMKSGRRINLTLVISK